MPENIVQNAAPQGPGIDWVALSAQTLEQLTVPLCLAIGIWLSVWVTVLGVAALRKFVKI